MRAAKKESESDRLKRDPQRERKIEHENNEVEKDTELLVHNSPTLNLVVVLPKPL